MQTTNVIHAHLTYIEENIKAIVTIEEIADMAGYSVSHYGRLFAQVTGLSVAAYIGKRRLDRALGEIIGGRRAIDVALDYGFDTYAGFYKAFVRMYGNSPKSYLKKEMKLMLTEKQLRDILTHWDIPQDLPILDVYIMDGTKIASNVWSIGEEYILKTDGREAMLQNLRVAGALAKQGFAAATPVLTKSGTEYLGLDGEKITVLTRGIKGSPLTKADRFGNGRRAFGYKYGESIARLHNALAAIESEIKLHDHNLYREVADWALPETKKQNIQFQMGLPDGFFDGYMQRFGAVYDALPKQLIHRDPNPGNILFDGGEVSGFIDFDLSRRTARLLDPCYCATGILVEWHGVDGLHEKWPDILEGILHGYDSVNPLTAEEKQSVFDIICSMQMICIAYFESQNELKALAKTNREMLQFIAAKQARIASIF